MKVEEIIAGINEEIALLKQVKQLLSGADAGQSRRNGKTGASTVSSSAPAETRRQLSPEARARIVAAQKKRWAAVKKAAKK